MAPNGGSVKMELNKGAWTPEEDRKLSQYIQIHGENRWRLVPAKAGLNRCGKSCRLRWLNYLRPNIKRGNISDQEEDLIIRLHKLLGNRWSLIAGRLPGRTDNEIKNYWNSHLSKRVGGARNEKKVPKSHNSTALEKNQLGEVLKGPSWKDGDVSTNEFNVDELFQFQEDVRVGTPLNSPEKKEGMERFGGSVGSSKGHLGWDWVRELLEFDEGVG